VLLPNIQIPMRDSSTAAASIWISSGTSMAHPEPLSESDSNIAPALVDRYMQTLFSVCCA